MQRRDVSNTQQCQSSDWQDGLNMSELGLTNWSELGLTNVELLRLHNDAATVHKIQRLEDLDRAA